jgi:hypothetical protein
MNKVQYKGYNANSGPSPAIWADCPWAEMQVDPNVGFTFWDDFVNFPKTLGTTEGNWGSYTSFGSSGSTCTAGTGVGGELVLTEATDNEGWCIRQLPCPFKLIRGGGAFWFEVRIKTSTIADTKFGFLVGLMDNTAVSVGIPLTIGGALYDTNLCGFHRLEGDGDKLDTVYKADGVTAVTLQADAVTLVADTYVKVGWKYDPSTYVLTFYSNGTALATTKTIPSAAGTDFPNDVTMGFVLGATYAASDSQTATIDWVRIAQLRT